MIRKVIALFLIIIYALTTSFGEVMINSCATQTSSCSKNSSSCCCKNKSSKKCSHSKYNISYKKQVEHNIINTSKKCFNTISNQSKLANFHFNLASLDIHLSFTSLSLKIPKKRLFEFFCLWRI